MRLPPEVKQANDEFMVFLRKVPLGQRILGAFGAEVVAMGISPFLPAPWRDINGLSAGFIGFFSPEIGEAGRQLASRIKRRR